MAFNVNRQFGTARTIMEIGRLDSTYKGGNYLPASQDNIYRYDVVMTYENEAGNIGTYRYTIESRDKLSYGEIQQKAIDDLNSNMQIPNSPPPPTNASGQKMTGLIFDLDKFYILRAY